MFLALVDIVRMIDILLPPIAFMLYAVQWLALACSLPNRPHDIRLFDRGKRLINAGENNTKKATMLVMTAGTIFVSPGLAQ